MELTNVCMKCNNKWKENNPRYCPECGTEDFCVENEINYKDITLEDCFILYHTNKYACVCDGDSRLVIAKEEE